MNKSLLKICGQRWARVLSPVEAAAYCHFASVASFREVPELAETITMFDGKERVDRQKLDEAIDKLFTKEKN